MTDFEMQLKWSCDHTWLPFLKSFCPSENYWLLKRGSEFRLCNGSYPSESTMRPTDDCTSSFIFSRQPSDADGFRLEHKMLAYDFDSDEYVDLFDKNRFDDDYWLDQAIFTAENGLLDQKFAIKNCLLTESQSLRASHSTIDNSTSTT